MVLEPILRVTGSGCTGQLVASAEPALRPLFDCADPAALVAALRDVSLVKQSSVRTVYQGSLALESASPLHVHLKLHRPVRFTDRARDAARGPKSAAEFQALRAALDAQLPVVRPLAEAHFDATEGIASTGNWLLTETVPNAEAAPSGYLDGACMPEPIARAGGALLRLAHDAGLHAQDLHPGNLLIDPEGRAWLVDLAGATLAQPLDGEQRARALAFFCQHLDGNLADAQAAPLRAAYRLHDFEEEKLSARAVQHGKRLRGRALESFGRRAMRPCRETAVVTAPGVRHRKSRSPKRYWHIADPGSTDRDAIEVALAALPDAEAVKSGRRGGVWVFDDVVCKTRSRSDSRHLWRNLYWLLFARVPTARPVVLHLGVTEGVVVTERVPAEDLSVVLPKLTPEQVREAAMDLGASLGRLHALGLRNRDLKLENLILDPDSGRVLMVDLDGVRRKAPMDGRGQAADLGRLLAGYEDAGAPGRAVVAPAFVRAYLHSRLRLGLGAPTAWQWQHVVTRARGYRKNSN